MISPESADNRAPKGAEGSDEDENDDDDDDDGTDDSGDDTDDGVTTVEWGWFQFLLVDKKSLYHLPHYHVVPLDVELVRQSEQSEQLETSSVLIMCIVYCAYVVYVWLCV